MSANWHEEAELELIKAREALKAGFKGRSRVSARRAAGLAVREYYRHQSAEVPPENLYKILLRFSEHPALPNNIRLVSKHLCQRVDQSYSLPDNVDLVTDAEQLIQYLAEQLD
jgi:HEPN domain-containing protein